jgi:hypothetical protein
MKRMAALCGALLLTLVLASPATAHQKVWMPEFSGSYQWEAQVSIADGWDWQCSGIIYEGGYGRTDFWLWYPNGVDTTDPAAYMPEGRAWPWIKGQTKGTGVDYFSSKPGMEGKVAAGKWTWTDQVSEHHPGTPGSKTDLESWKETMAGKMWGIQLPGYGTVFHQSGGGASIVTVIEQVPGPYDTTASQELRPFHGNSTFDVRQLCAFFGFEAVFP